MSDRRILDLPKQVKPSAIRTASAPYNFVPLPEIVVTAVASAEQLPNHNTYANQGYPHTGYFEVLLTTKSPVYVRCPFTLSEFLRQERGEDAQRPFREQVKNTPDFFYTRDPNQPVIPGSSLRGMLRGLLEIVSYGKVQWVTDKKLFFRTVDDTAVGQYYNTRMVEELGMVRVLPAPSAPGYRSRVRGGLLRFRANGTCVIEECIVARVEVNDTLSAFRLRNRRELYQLNGRPLTPQNERNPNQTPIWTYQHNDIWADIDPTEKDYFFPRQRRPNGGLRHPDLYLRFRRATNVRASTAPGKAKGKLVLTGNMEFKHLAFMFVPDSSLPVLDVPNNPDEEDLNKRLVERFHDDDQITRWQSLAFPDGQPAGQRRERDGCLRDGEPVFFLTDSGGYGNNIVFLGRAQMFRLPYTQRPLDLVPPELRRPEDVDYVDALFGFARTRRELEEMKQRGISVPDQGSKTRAYASRVCITDATLVEGQTDIWFPHTPIMVPKILATPKPTSFQHYLVQTSDNKNTLTHYDSSTPDETVIRGHKRYWHQGMSISQGLTLEEILQRIQEEAQRMREIAQQEDQGRPDTQHTQFRPVKPEVRFRFRVYFENLSDRELGALCWVLHPLGDASKEYCHQIGMGKPWGLGAVKLTAALHLTNRSTRYSSLFDGDNWQTGIAGTERPLSDRSVLESLTKKFEQHVLGVLQPNRSCTHLSEMQRIGMLLKMLEWPGFRPQVAATPDNRFLVGQGRPNTRYMSVRLPGNDVPAGQRNEYRDRPVLPDPSAFGSLTGNAEPTIEAARVDPPPIPQVVVPSVSTRRESVTLTEDTRRNTARVETADGEIIVCTGFPGYPVARRGMSCRADVIRHNGKPQSATFKGWN
jgi:CRISPR-associated protein (TIGR03986 family)